MMHYHYGPSGTRTTPWGAPIPPPFNPRRRRPPLLGMGDLSTSVTSGFNKAIKTGLEFGAGYVIGSSMAPSAKDKVAYGVGAGLTTMMFGVVGLGVAALVVQQTRK